MAYGRDKRRLDPGGFDNRPRGFRRSATLGLGRRAAALVEEGPCPRVVQPRTGTAGFGIRRPSDASRCRRLGATWSSSATRAGTNWGHSVWTVRWCESSGVTTCFGLLPQLMSRRISRERSEQALGDQGRSSARDSSLFRWRTTCRRSGGCCPTRPATFGSRNSRLRGKSRLLHSGQFSIGKAGCWDSSRLLPNS